MTEPLSDQSVPIIATCSHARCATMGTYDMTGKCHNCKWEGTIRYTQGHVKSPATCPRCGCLRMVFAYDFKPANTEPDRVA